MARNLRNPISPAFAQKFQPFQKHQRLPSLKFQEERLAFSSLSVIPSKIFFSLSIDENILMVKNPVIASANPPVVLDSVAAALRSYFLFLLTRRAIKQIKSTDQIAKNLATEGATAKRTMNIPESCKITFQKVKVMLSCNTSKERINLRLLATRLP